VKVNERKKKAEGIIVTVGIAAVCLPLRMTFLRMALQKSKCGNVKGVRGGKLLIRDLSRGIGRH
jgi:hypothetical protein